MENINAKEIKEILKYVISNNLELVANNKKKSAVEIVGESGIGKTSIIMQLSDEMDLNFAKLNLAQIEELGDLVGYPVKEFKVIDNHTQKEMWIQEDVLSAYINDGFSIAKGCKPRMSYAPPEWLPTDLEKGGILLLDDWTRGDQRFVQATMEIIDRGEYISWTLPENWHVVLSANPSGGDYQVNSVDNAQKTRYMSFGLEFDAKIWAEWAESEGIDGRCINFVLMHPEIMNKEGGVQTINARSLVTFFNTISGIKDFSTSSNLALILMIASGCFTSSNNIIGNLFTSFINNKMDRLIQPERILTGDWKEVNSEIRKVVGRQSNDTYSAAVASTLTIRFMNYVLDGLDKKKINPGDVVDRVVQIIDNNEEALLSMDLVFQLVKKLVGGKHTTSMQKLLSNPKVMQTVLG